MNGKERFCCNCGVSIGFVENRYYDHLDTCGSLECDRAIRDMYAEEREAAHRQLDEDLGW